MAARPERVYGQNQRPGWKAKVTDREVDAVVVWWADCRCVSELAGRLYVLHSRVCADWVVHAMSYEAGKQDRRRYLRTCVIVGDIELHAI